MQVTTHPAPATVRHILVVRLIPGSYFFTLTAVGGSNNVSVCAFNLPSTDKVLTLCSPAAIF
jgi:hypothetical protein